MKTVTRRKSFRGQQLTATTREGQTFTGTMLGWGSSFLRLRTADGKWTELATCTLDAVTEAQA